MQWPWQGNDAKPVRFVAEDGGDVLGGCRTSITWTLGAAAG
jgi:hypothetical protein